MNITPVPLSEAEQKQTYRPYYSEDNAMSLKSIFDNLISQPSNYFFSAVQAQCSPSTLNSKFLYAIKWLCDNHSEKEKYRALRERILIRRTGTGVNIVFREERPMLSSILTATMVADNTVKLSWFDTFVKWTTTAKEFDVFDSYQVFSGVVEITDSEEQALIKLCAPLGIELDVQKDAGKFKAMR